MAAINSSIDVINAALTRVGEEPITSITEASSGAKIANANYDHIVEAALSDHPWKWASRTAVLNMLDAAVHGTAPQPWTETWQLPADLGALRSVEVAGKPIKYKMMSDKLFAAQGTGAELVAFYTWSPPEADWPAWFTEYVVQRLEAVFLRGIGERYSEADAREESAEKLALPRAKRRDAMNEPPKDPYVSGVLRARRG